MLIRIFLVFLLLLPASRALAQSRVPAAASTSPISQISWGKQADGYRNGQSVTMQCTPYGTPATVWGSDIYTADSSICTAAVHSGLITFEAGGIFVVEMKPGMGSYMGTFRNGVATERYGQWSDWGGDHCPRLSNLA